MQLFFNAASPFVRKVLVAAHETGLAERVEPVTVALSPVSPHDGLRARNPLGKIPALLADDGTVLYDSRVICEYLDSLHGGRRLFPDSGPARWTALRRQALADGILDAAVLVRYERAVRPPERQWPGWIDAQMLKVRTALDALEDENLDGPFDIGRIAVACALGYLDFRYPDEPWRDSRPGLAAWFAGAANRPAMAQTAPKA